MKQIAFLFLLLGMCTPAIRANWRYAPNPSPSDSVQNTLVIDAREMRQLDLNLPDGGLPPLPGVTNLQIFRSSADDPLSADGDGWTYAHHMDLAIWKGRMYAAWNMTRKDEDRPPSKVVFATSSDGFHWTSPVDLFPREWAMACRFYFYRAHNGKMLAFCAGNFNQGIISEAKKNVLLVREITAQHTLGPVFTLVNPGEATPPPFEQSTDAGFIAACQDAFDNKPLLEQQDYGVFLGNRRMEWHDKTAPYKGFYKFGKAFCFFHRADGLLVGMSKMGFVTLSADEGNHWSPPTLPPTLTAGAAKVWGQRTYDRQYVLAYNPDPARGKRYPLVLVRGEDGIHFQDMRVIHGEFSPIRYDGLYKDPGYQYVRGVSEWSNDSTFADKKSIWLIYSVNKEDIWISRIPLPAGAPDGKLRREHFAGPDGSPIIPGWNVYCPKWAPVSTERIDGISGPGCLVLKDGDPENYAQAARLFDDQNIRDLSFRIRSLDKGSCETELNHADGKTMGILSIQPDGKLQWVVAGKSLNLGEMPEKGWINIRFRIDGKGILVCTLNGHRHRVETAGGLPKRFGRITFRTGPRHALTDQRMTEPGGDRRSANPSLIQVTHFTVR
ncbi:MAG: exo-alpha-sialidase [Marinilabiliales bacterium]|nr:exo-alpha-sialidase [Marinilabiliales bacterium]